MLLMFVFRLFLSWYGS